MDRAGKCEGRGNAGGTVASFFHPSRLPGFGCLVRRKGLVQRRKSADGTGRMPIHLGNPG